MSDRNCDDRLNQSCQCCPQCGSHDVEATKLIGGSPEVDGYIHRTQKLQDWVECNDCGAVLKSSNTDDEMYIWYAGEFNAADLEDEGT